MRDSGQAAAMRALGRITDLPPMRMQSGWSPTRMSRGASHLFPPPPCNTLFPREGGGLGGPGKGGKARRETGRGLGGAQTVGLVGRGTDE